MMDSRKKITALLIGNPNCGKTSIFNAVTGAHEKIGNYPGVTVEKAEATASFFEGEITFVDLPGAYGLFAYSEDEKVARNYLLESLRPNSDSDRIFVAVNIVDASNLERSLYLTLQLKEMGVPLVVVLNMIDGALIKGLTIEAAPLAKCLGVPVVPTVGHKNKGTNRIPGEIFAAVKSADKPLVPPLIYPTEIEEKRAVLLTVLPDAASEAPQDTFRPNESFRRFIAMKLLEGDAEVPDYWRTSKVRSILAHLGDVVKNKTGEMEESEDEVMIASTRYNYISRLCEKTLVRSSGRKRSFADHLDAIFLHRYLGIPIFLTMMFVVFYSTFTVGAIPMGWIENGFSLLSEGIRNLWPPDSKSLLQSLLIDGAIGGVRGVISFLPNILILFLAISFLEDSGYMSRAAFLMNRFMNQIGLQGKSFIPLVMGFGCSVPAVMAARILENRRQRITTILVIPFMSCGAHFLIYMLIIPAFFPPKYGGLVLWLIYLLGIVMAMTVAKLLRSTILKGEDADLILELPPWHWPTLSSIGLSALEKGWLYLKKAGTVLLGVSVILWALTAFPRLSQVDQERFALMRASVGGTTSELTDTEVLRSHDDQMTEIDHLEMEEALSQSYVGCFGRFLEPTLQTMGFDWKIGTALIGSLAAKEIFVTQMGIVCRVGNGEKNEASLRVALKKNYSPLTGLCIMIFAVLGPPCVATIVMIARETGAWKWAVGEFVFLTALAWTVTTVVYHLARVLGWG